jgi:hypothetical protein
VEFDGGSIGQGRAEVIRVVVEHVLREQGTRPAERRR